jgi:hypothetical protein
MYACQLIMRTYTEAKKFDKLKAFGAELSQITGDPQFEIYTKQFAKDQSLVDSVLQDSE